jgi:hypothetical protein
VSGGSLFFSEVTGVRFWKVMLEPVLKIIGNFILFIIWFIDQELANCRREFGFPSQQCICSQLELARGVDNCELPLERLLLDPGQPRVLHVIQGLVSEHTHQGFVIGGHIELLA